MTRNCFVKRTLLLLRQPWLDVPSPLHHLHKTKARHSKVLLPPGISTMVLGCNISKCGSSFTSNINLTLPESATTMTSVSRTELRSWISVLFPDDTSKYSRIHPQRCNEKRIKHQHLLHQRMYTLPRHGSEVDCCLAFCIHNTC